jgi:hypothetical protein
MIQTSEIIPTLLNICPDFRSAWEEHLRYWSGEIPGIYNDTAEFVHYLVDRYEHGDRTGLPLVFETIESFITQGTPDTREVAILGILETLQCVASHRPFGEEAFVEYLQPASKAAWDELTTIWEGKSSLADVIRGEIRGDA